MKYIEDFNLILEMAEDENEKLSWLLITVMEVPVMEKTPEGGLVYAHI